MLGKIAGMIIIISVFFGIMCGNAEALAGAVLEGASDAVGLTISLVGMMCLWCGVLRVLKEAGAIKGLTRLIKPVIKLFFPDAARYDDAAEDIAANISANLLGVGNAATPLAISAMKKLQRINPDPERASADMITLAVLNTSSLSLIPSTTLTILRASGSSDPFSVIPPIWITSFTCSALALILCRIAGSVTKKARGGVL